MKVLVLHNKYKIAGGEDVSTAAEVDMLSRNGIDVEVIYLSNLEIGDKGKLQLAMNTIWSREQYNIIYDKVKNGGFDIVHVQNFFPQFSPSVFYAAKKAGAKVLMSVRNYRLICPNASLYINDKICYSCVGKTVPVNAVLNKCYRDSIATTGVVAAMLSVHNVMHTWTEKIDGLICISNFVKKQLLDVGFDATKLFLKYNFVQTTIPPSFQIGEYYIFVGRLSREKGIYKLLETFAANGQPLKIIGDGPLLNEVIKTAFEYDNIHYLGKLALDETYKAISQSKALVFTSLWHEPFGRTIVEAFAHGTPVIGTALGGVTELIKHQENGILFDPEAPDSLQAALELFEQSDMIGMRNTAHESFLKRFQTKQNFTTLMGIYTSVLSK
jgi:glycosyltransferase involved in cell wall biosynthesis